jgi:hypothetical protein
MAKIKQPTKAELRKRLARDIAAVFANPELPTVVYNGLAEAMNELFNSIPQSRLDESEAYLSALIDEAANVEKVGVRQ